jgi:hypothetical protein
VYVRPSASDTELYTHTKKYARLRQLSTFRSSGFATEDTKEQFSLNGTKYVPSQISYFVNLLVKIILFCYEKRTFRTLNRNRLALH